MTDDDDDLHQVMMQKSGELDSGFILKVQLDRICWWFDYGVGWNRGFWLNNWKNKVAMYHMGNTIERTSLGRETKKGVLQMFTSLLIYFCLNHFTTLTFVQHNCCVVKQNLNPGLLIPDLEHVFLMKFYKSNWMKLQFFSE